MEDSYQNKIDEAMAKLPEESRQAINNINWKLLILSLKKYTPDQLDDLEVETELLLCGITKPEDYPIELEDRLHLTKEDVISLIKEMNTLVFQKIEMELKRILDGKEKFKNKQATLDPRFSKLPKDVGQAIAQSGWQDNLYGISQKYKLNIEQMGIFENDTVKLITNEILPNNYESILASDLKISEDTLKSLVSEVNDKIMLNIRELLKKVVDNKEGGVEKSAFGFDKIPLPPYSKIKSDHREPIAPLRINNEPEVKEQLKQVPIINKQPVNIIIKDNNKDILPPVPPKIEKIPTNIIEEKLNNLTISDKTIPVDTDKVTVNNKPSDPYREPF